MAEKKRILAIDDDPLVLKVLTSVLTPMYELHFSKSAEEAMDKLKECPPDLMLLDINMPGMSGFEFLHTIKRLPDFGSIPVIVVTGHYETEFIIYAERSGAKSVVAKPINNEDLLKKIEKALSQGPKE